jgi:hypothetical protein
VVLLVKKTWKIGLNEFYIVNSINRGKITMTGFDPIFGIQWTSVYSILILYWAGIRTALM